MFINKYCWTRGTYYAVQTYDHQIFSFTPTKENVIYYYQWVPIFLLAQSLCFYMPYVLWNFFVNKLLDTDLYSLIKTSKQLDRNLIGLNNNDPSRTRKFIASHMILSHLNFSSPDFIERLKRAAQMPDAEQNFQNLNLFSSYDNFNFLIHRLSKSCLCISYIFIKILYFIVTIVQIYFTHQFIWYFIEFYL